MCVAATVGGGWWVDSASVDEMIVGLSELGSKRRQLLTGGIE